MVWSQRLHGDRTSFCRSPVSGPRFPICPLMTIQQRIRVPVGFAYAALFLYFSRPALPWFLPGIALGSLGLCLRIWATGHLEKWSGLAVSGPYRYTRNPLYLGSFVMGLGISLAGGVPWLALLFVGLFFFLYQPVMRREEQELLQAYGPQARAYLKSTPLFWPMPRRSPAPELQIDTVNRAFLWKRVVRNREYNAAIGFVILAAVIFVKMQ